MRRRTVIGRGMTASLALLGGVTMASPPNPAIDAIVIGAGLAGLACAQRLMAAGRTVVVLEARQRIGGRKHGDRFKAQRRRSPCDANRNFAAIGDQNLTVHDALCLVDV